MSNWHCWTDKVAKNLEKTEKKTKTKSFDPWRGSEEKLDKWHGMKHFSPSARWGLLDFIRAVVLRLLLLLLLLRLLLQFLLDHVCINFHLHFRLANSSPSSSPTSELSAHCWTSTWDLPSSVRTAGPQPGTFPAQCAPLDLNLGPSELSAHRWTSTWGLPSSARTAGPQRPDRMPEDMPVRMSDRMPEDMPDKMP